MASGFYVVARAMSERPLSVVRGALFVATGDEGKRSGKRTCTGGLIPVDTEA